MLKTARFLRNVFQKANVERVSQAPPQQQPQQHSASAGTRVASSREQAHDVQEFQRVEREVVHEPPEPVQQRSEEQAVDEPGEKSPRAGFRNLVWMW